MTDTTLMTTNDPAESDAPRRPPVRLTKTRAEAQQQLRNQLKIGVAIKEQRIRSPWDLDQARIEKQEWVNRTVELLGTLFSDTTMAELFNDWVGTVLPEYAEFAMFVEQFVQEMKQRIKRLQEISKRLEDLRDPSQPLQQAASTPSQETTMSTMTTPKARPGETEAASVAVATKPVAAVSVLLLPRCDDAVARQAVTDFMTKLGLDVSVIGAEQDNSRVANELSCVASASFVLALTDGSPASMESGTFLFELGCCVGRMGVTRVFVMHRTDAPGGVAADQSTTLERLGVRRILVDATGEGWHLTLARHLRAAGVDVDLNRLV